MLAKLTKYEIRATARILGILYAALIIIAIVTRIEMAIESLTNGRVSMIVPTGIIVMLYICGIVAIGVLTFILIVQRFYKNLLQNEGYLMHTLPVKMWQHIASKLIVSIVWCFASMIVVFATFMIIGSGEADFGNIISTFVNISFRGYESYLVNGIALILELLILMIVGAAASILHIYLSMAIGQMADNHKILCSFGAYVGINIILQIISGALITVSNGFAMSDENAAMFAHMHLIMLMLIVVCIIRAVIFFVCTDYLMKNKLNLE